MNIIFDNNLEGLKVRPFEPGKMQQGSDLHSSCFINNFHWRREQNKVRQNKSGTLLPDCRTRVTFLFFSIFSHIFST